MTLEERVVRAEACVKDLAKGGQQTAELFKSQLEGIRLIGERVTSLEAQLKELDFMVLAIHAAIKDVQERV